MDNGAAPPPGAPPGGFVPRDEDAEAARMRAHRRHRLGMAVLLMLVVSVLFSDYSELIEESGDDDGGDGPGTPPPVDPRVVRACVCVRAVFWR